MKETRRGLEKKDNDKDNERKIMTNWYTVDKRNQEVKECEKNIHLCRNPNTHIHICVETQTHTYVKKEKHTCVCIIDSLPEKDILTNR